METDRVFLGTGQSIQCKLDFNNLYDYLNDGHFYAFSPKY